MQQQRPPSILILNRTFPPYFGASGRMACDLVLHLRKQGHPITVITTAPSATVDKATNLNVIRVEGERTPKGKWDYYDILKKMHRAAKKLPPHHIVISMTDPPMLADVGKRIAKSMGAKHIHWAQDIYPDLLPVIGTNMPKFIYNLIERRIYGAMKSADAVVPISKCIANALTYKSVNRRIMHVIENWPEKLLFENTNQQIMPLFDDSEPKFRILYAGTVGLAHEFSPVIEATKYFQDRHPEIEFVFVGRGRGLQKLADAKARFNLENIRFLPPQPPKNVKSMMEAGDIHLVTMKDAASGKLFPSKFYSACAVGRPVIFVGPENCDLHQKITQSKCGVSIRTNDPKSLIRGILSYRNDGDAWFKAASAAKSLGLNAEEKSLKSWEDLIATIG